MILNEYTLNDILASSHVFHTCDEAFFFFFFYVIIFHSSQFEIFISSIQLNHMHSDFYFGQKIHSLKQFKHQYK